MNAHVIDFTPEGSVQAMHNDKFDLSFLGAQTIERATEIKFDEVNQRWGIWFPTGKVICLIGRDPATWPRVFAPSGESAAGGFHTYDGARRIEVAWLNACRIEGCEPTSAEGIAVLKFLRVVNPPDL